MSKQLRYGEPVQARFDDVNPPEKVKKYELQERFCALIFEQVTKSFTFYFDCPLRKDQIITLYARPSDGSRKTYYYGSIIIKDVWHNERVTDGMPVYNCPYIVLK